MTNVGTEISFEKLWDTVPYPGFVISNDNRILTANSAAETYCLSSIKQIRMKSLDIYFGMRSLQ